MIRNQSLCKSFMSKLILILTIYWLFDKLPWWMVSIGVDSSLLSCRLWPGIECDWGRSFLALIHWNKQAKSCLWVCNTPTKSWFCLVCDSWWRTWLRSCGQNSVHIHQWWHNEPHLGGWVGGIRSHCCIRKRLSFGVVYNGSNPGSWVDRPFHAPSSPLRQTCSV